MKLALTLMLVGVAYAARLENTYLPPSNAATAGGHNAGLAAPFGGPSGPSGGATAFQAAGSFGSGSFGARPAGGRPSGARPGAGFSSGSQFNAASFSGPSGAGGFQQQSGGFVGGGAGSGAGFGGRPQGPAAPIIPITKYSSTPSDENGNYAYSYETGNGISAQEVGRLNAAQGSFSYVGDDGQTYSIQYSADENGFQAQGAHIPTPPPIPEEILRALEKNAADEAAGIFDDGLYRGEGLADSRYQGGSSGAGAGFGQGSAFNQGAGSGAYNQGAGGAGFSQGAGGAGFSQGGYKQQGGFSAQAGGFKQGGGSGFQASASSFQGPRGGSAFQQSGSAPASGSFGIKQQQQNAQGYVY